MWIFSFFLVKTAKIEFRIVSDIARISQTETEMIVCVAKILTRSARLWNVASQVVWIINLGIRSYNNTLLFPLFIFNPHLPATPTIIILSASTDNLASKRPSADRTTLVYKIPYPSLYRIPLLHQPLMSQHDVATLWCQMCTRHVQENTIYKYILWIKVVTVNTVH